MSTQGSTDEERLRRAVEEIRGHGDADSFRAGAVAAARRLVDGEIASYNEIPLVAGDHVVVADPAETLVHGDVVEMFEAYARQNPMVAHYEHTRDPSALRFSDLISQRELRRLDLYAHVYRPLQIEHQIAMAFPADDRVIGLTMSRSAIDFTDDERDLFERARPLLVAAYRDLVAREQLRAMVAHLESLYGDAGVILLARDGSPSALSPGAARWLARLATGDGHGLQVRLRGWIAEARRRANSDLLRAAPESPGLRLATDAGVVTMRFVAGANGIPDALVLRASQSATNADALRRLGLTRRQAQVLSLLSQGLTNQQIAAELYLSPHTIDGHVEQVYRRLGVSSRAAAVRAVADRLGAG